MAATSYSLRTFYTLVVTQTLSALGSQMSSLAIGIWVLVQTGNTTLLLLVPFFGFLPTMLFRSLAGVYADRLSRRKLIILGDSGQAVMTFLLMLSFASGAFQL